ncbi:MAG: 1,4-dihydroxy-6-naphthoate synthase [Desulfobacteraceae bacterium]|nr:1,4-dihydroxy-6-naphthoate synthase [Desulfobacteraceae bacterium]
MGMTAGMAGRTISIGFSSCPNDTNIFYALLHKKVPFPFEIVPQITDVEDLNQMAIRRKLDVSKISYGVLDRILDDYILLKSGSAIGRGCGPIIVAKKGMDAGKLKSARIAIPGLHTTAALLLRLYCPEAENLVPMNFAEIARAVAEGEVDAGAIIHETRFIYHEYGLVCLEDLGSWWEGGTGLPIPLGGIIAKRSLGHELLQTLDNALKLSVLYGMRKKDESLDFVRRHAQEMSLEVIDKHIKLYVNDYTADLGEEGLKAVDFLIKMAQEKGIFRQDIASVGKL